MLEERYNESTIAEQSEFGYVKIIEPALVPNSPIKPKKRMNLALGMILGLGLGVGIVFLKEYISDTIHTPEEITQKNWILLSTIPKMNGKKVNGKNGNGNGNGKKSKEKIFIQDGIDKLHLLSFINPRSILAESYRQLRTNINYAQIGKDIKTILVSSPNPGEGKTTTATNLAVAYAQMGKKVLLLETDLRRPNVHKRFHCEKEPGLVNLLLGDISQSEIIDNCRVENLHIICCGSIPPNPAEMLSTDKMRKFMEEMRESYDVIILDSPPVLAVADPVILSTLVDGVIFVVSASRTTFHSTELSFERVERVGGKVLGIVLNKFDPRRAYGGYYNYKSKYYYNYYYNNKTYYSSEEVDINNDQVLERL
jgi:tyrosine-protein kinase Etk/Wzc